MNDFDDSPMFYAMLVIIWALSMVLLFAVDDGDRARIADHNVPDSLECTEEEVISLIPGGIGCVHVDVIAEEVSAA